LLREVCSRKLLWKEMTGKGTFPATGPQGETFTGGGKGWADPRKRRPAFRPQKRIGGREGRFIKEVQGETKGKNQKT